MRALGSLAVLASLATGACEDASGAYITVRSDVAFDRLEYGFGVPVPIERGEHVPNPPGRMPVPDEPLKPTGKLFARARAATDSVEITGTTTSHTYRLPAGGKSAELGAYLLVRAFAADELVGVGELWDFDVPDDDIVYLYDVDLAPLRASAMMTPWGIEHDDDCLRYDTARTDGHPDRVALVLQGDSDCDTFADLEIDCDPLVHCDGVGGQGCLSSIPCIEEVGSCVALSRCENSSALGKMCADPVCLDQRSCDSCNLSSSSPQELLDCAAATGSTHPEFDVGVPMMVPDTLCANPKLEIALTDSATNASMPCTNPSLVGVAWPLDSYIDPNVTFAVGMSNQLCRIEIELRDPTERDFNGIPHLLIAFGDDGARTSFIIGLKDLGPNACQPTAVPYAVLVGRCEAD